MENGFPFITHLETRGMRMLERGPSDEHEARSFIVDIIRWGGAQHGLDLRFETAMDSQSNSKLAQKVLLQIKEMLCAGALEDPSKAIATAMELPRVHLTYGSKILRFLNPVNFPAVDLRIEKVFGGGNYPVLRNTPPRSVERYVKWYQYIRRAKNCLRESLHPRDNKPWTAARIEMALFQFATEELEKSAGSVMTKKPVAPASVSAVPLNDFEDHEAFTTLGKCRSFWVRRPKPDIYTIETSWGSGRVFKVDRRMVWELLDHFRGKGWFPLANDVVKVRGGTEDKCGLGVYVVECMKLLATDAFILGSWLVESGALEWNEKKRDIQFRVREDWDGSL